MDSDQPKETSGHYHNGIWFEDLECHCSEKDAPKRRTRLALVNSDGVRLAYWDVSGIPQSDTQFPVMVALEQVCDMGDWHQVAVSLVPAVPGIPVTEDTNSHGEKS
jgi:hypothetical protein